MSRVFFQKMRVSRKLLLAAAILIATFPLMVCGAEKEENYTFHIVEKNINVPSVKGSYTFLYLTDSHIIKLSGKEDTQVTDNALPRQTAFIDNAGNCSYEKFPEWISYANEADVDMVLLGGDIMDFPSEENLACLTQNLSALNMPYVYTMGNHDWTYPWEYMTPKGRETYRPLFNSFTNNSPAAVITEYEELVVLSVDNSSNQIESAALAKVDEAFSLGKPVILIMHVPFSTTTLLQNASKVWGSPVSIDIANEGGIYPNADTLAFEEKVFAEDSPVVCILAGHVHFADEALLSDRIPQIVGDAAYKGEGLLLHIN